MTFGRAVLLAWCEYKDKNRDCLTRELGHILYCYTKEWGVADLKKKISVQDSIYDTIL